MAVDPLGALLGDSLQQHLLGDEPSLVQHLTPDADFWIDSWSERDAVTLTGDIGQTLSSAHTSTGQTAVRSEYGFTGVGQTVAVIDSGIAWNHTALGAGLGTSYRVVGGWDFTENDANPSDDGPWGSHGTHVAGIIGADAAGLSNDGVASGVDLVGLRVFDDSGAGYFSWVESALRWVHQNRNTFENPITAVNLSLGTSWNASTVPNWAMLEDEFAQLKADGIFIAVSAGNSFSTAKTPPAGSYNVPGLSYPAASPHVVPVMAVTDTGSLSSFSQRHTRAIGAPGQSIYSSVPDYAGNNNGVHDDYASFSGTSMAAPYVAGASVLVRQAMQFVGYSHITQDTIYNHMLATANSFFDSATSQAYKRINVANAVNALMPLDDYGSTTNSAHSLGTISGVTQVTGLIGKLNDTDVFQFTAASTGAVAFTVATSHSLVPLWSGSGGRVSGDGLTFTMNVTAGQTYNVGLATSDGIGFYGLTAKAQPQAAPGIADWGTITQSIRADRSNTGETWYKLTASRSGCLTAEALFAAAGGNIDIALFNGNQQLVANGSANWSGERVDAWVNAGSTYYLRVTGTNADIDFRLTNLLSFSGSTLTVDGTPAADDFVYSASNASYYTVSVNGTAYMFTTASLPNVQFNGGAGSDSVTMTGNGEADTVTLRVANTRLQGTGYAAIANDVEEVTVHGGGGHDVVTLYDTSGNDTYSGYHNRASMVGDGYSYQAIGFDRYDAVASAGRDTASLYDSAGNDLFRAYADRSVMSGIGFFNRAVGFDRVDGFATAGIDTAMLFDSCGNGVFAADTNCCWIASQDYINEAADFEIMQSRDTAENIVSVFQGASYNGAALASSLAASVAHATRSPAGSVRLQSDDSHADRASTRDNRLEARWTRPGLTQRFNGTWQTVGEVRGEKAIVDTLMEDSPTSDSLVWESQLEDLVSERFAFSFEHRDLQAIDRVFSTAERLLAVALLDI